MWEREGPVGGGMVVVYWPSHYLEGERETKEYGLCVSVCVCVCVSVCVGEAWGACKGECACLCLCE